MKRNRTTACQNVLLLLALLLTAPQPVKAESGDSVPSPLFVGMMTPDIPGSICMGKKMALTFYFVAIEPVTDSTTYYLKNATVDITTKKGKAFPKQFEYFSNPSNKMEKGKFTYTAGLKEGEETIEIKVTRGIFEATLPIKFWVKKCQASVQFNQSTTIAMGPVTIDNTYFGSGTIKTNEEGQLSGNGIQALWGDIAFEGAEGSTCKHEPPWEGSSDIIFNGQVDENDNITLAMNMDSLSVSASEVVCTDSSGWGGFPFPAYTYEACRVTWPDLNFDSDTVEIPFDCPGEDPYSVPFTIIWRAES